jgi:RNA polymerase sigma-70 factor (ECF subfamily)
MEFAEGLKAGRREAWEEFVSEFGPRVMSYLRHRGHDHHTAEDLAQETFIDAFRSISGLADGRKLASWLYTIARRASIDHAAPLAGRDEPAIELVCDRKGRLARDAARLIGDDLSARDQEVLYLRYVARLTPAEIAAAWKCSSFSVRSRLWRLRRRLSAAPASAAVEEEGRRKKSRRQKIFLFSCAARSYAEENLANIAKNGPRVTRSTDYMGRGTDSGGASASRQAPGLEKAAVARRLSGEEIGRILRESVGEVELPPDFTERVLEKMADIHPFGVPAPPADPPAPPTILGMSSFMFAVSAALSCIFVVALGAGLWLYLGTADETAHEPEPVSKDEGTQTESARVGFRALARLLSEEGLKSSATELASLSPGRGTNAPEAQVERVARLCGFEVVGWLKTAEGMQPLAVARVGTPAEPAKPDSAEDFELEGHYAGDPVFVQRDARSPTDEAVDAE